MNSIPIITEKHKFFELSQDVNCISEPLLTYLGISYFAFKRTFSDSSKIYLFNNPYYYDHYFSKKYFLIGNREGGIESYTSSYDLWDYLPDPNRLYNEASECFNISHGLTITRKEGEFCDFFFFGTNRENPLVKKIYLNRREVFDHFCDHFLDIGKKIITTATESKVTLPYKPNSKTQEQPFHVDEFLKDISKYKSDWTKLTKRELDCAYFLIQGRSNKEIARELNISPRTVEDYITSIRYKVHCKSRSELISLLCKWPLGVIQNI